MEIIQFSDWKTALNFGDHDSILDGTLQLQVDIERGIEEYRLEQVEKILFDMEMELLFKGG